MANDDNLEVAMSKKADKTEVQSLQAAVGSPLTAITASAMIDTNKIYVYIGSETGYTNGDWYYWNGTAWIDGGVYNAVAFETDTTLTQSGQAADAKVVGDEIDELKSAFTASIDDLRDIVGLFEFTWAQGGIASSTGIEYSSTSNVRTPFIPVSGAKTIVVANKNTSGSNAALYEFAGNQTTASGVNERLAVTYIAPNTSKTITLNANTAYIRCQVSSGTLSDGDYLLVYTFNSIIANDYNKRIGEIINYNVHNVLSEYVGTNGTMNGVTYAFNGNKCTTTGATETSASYRNVYSNQTALPTDLKAGDNIFIKVKTTNEDVQLAIFYYSSNGLIGNGRYVTRDTVETIPDNCIGMIVRINVDSNIADASGVIEYAILANYQLPLAMKGILANNTDANNLIETSDNGVYLINSNSTYLHLPVTVGFLFNYIISYNTNLQLVYDWTSTNVYMRHRLNSAWIDWANISGVTNSYTFEQYENTYNITSSPTITTDTNAYLAPSGDTTDRTADIVSMLTSQGVCRLGKGDYYVSNLEMSSGTTIKGVGNKTRIILLGTSAGFAIKMKSYCTVSDCLIMGKTSSITLSDILDSESTVPLRHGILWQGTYTQDQSTANQPINSMVSNVRFLNFTGGAITCYDTGYGTFNALEVSNVFCMNCNVGINVSYWSEFHKFTNVRTASCYYGCINNGGNNVFINCDFSTCKVAVLMDNSQSQSPNNSHGSMIGCVFNHTDNNTGIGIKILNCNNGFIFSGCQIFYSQIYIEDSSGILISDTNFGENNCDITVVNGGTVLFANNMHKAAPPITITNNNNVHFVNCYARTGAVVSN